MTTTITITSNQENCHFSIIIEIPPTNTHHVINQPSADQLPVFRPENTGTVPSSASHVQSTGVQTDAFTQPKQKIDIKEEQIEMEGMSDFEEDSFDSDKEMDRILLQQLSYTSDDKDSASTPSQYGGSSSDFESEDEYLDLDLLASLGSVEEIIEYLQENAFDG